MPNPMGASLFGKSIGQFKFEVQHLLKTDVEREIHESSFDSGKLSYERGNLLTKPILRSGSLDQGVAFIFESTNLHTAMGLSALMAHGTDSDENGPFGLKAFYPMTFMG